MVEDLSMGLIENKRKDERFEGVRDVSMPLNLFQSSFSHNLKQTAAFPVL